MLGQECQGRETSTQTEEAARLGSCALPSVLSPAAPTERLQVPGFSLVVPMAAAWGLSGGRATIADASQQKAVPMPAGVAWALGQSGTTEAQK
jgi:hypothetical protein